MKMEQLQLEVETLVYKQERLDSIIEDLEITDDLTKKSKIQIVKLVITKLDEKLEAESEQEQKLSR